MAFTFCPKCGTKVEWAYSCSQCGARNLLYHPDHASEKGLEPPEVEKDHSSTPSDSGARQETAYTFCPRCGAKTKWGPSCSGCGAGIPAYDPRHAQKEHAETAQWRESTQTKQGTGEWRRKPVGALLALVVVVGVVAAVIVGILWVGRGSRTSDIQSPDSPSTSDYTAPKITAVTVSGIAGTRATVAWVTDEPATSQVEYGPDMASYSTTDHDSARMTTHSVTIRSLEPGVTYHFRVKSTDAGGNSATSDPLAFDTPLVETVSTYVTFRGQKIVGADGDPIVLENNKEAVDVTWEDLKQFRLNDQTDKIPYVDSAFVCADFAETLHNNAEKAGIKAAFVALDFYGDQDGHAVNAFNTIDNGVVHIDDTGSDTGVPCAADTKVVVEVDQQLVPQFVFSCPGYSVRPMGTVAYSEVTQ